MIDFLYATATFTARKALRSLCSRNNLWNLSYVRINYGFLNKLFLKDYIVNGFLMDFQ